MTRPHATSATAGGERPLSHHCHHHHNRHRHHHNHHNRHNHHNHHNRHNRHNTFLLYLVSIFALLQLSYAFTTVPDSGCLSVCADVSLDADAVCLDTDFNSTTAGSRLESCVSCLLASTAVDTSTNETDVEFGLLALRFTLSSCMFGIPDERVSLSSPCQVTCAPLNASIGYNLTKTPAATDSRLDFCTASRFDDTTINNCAYCYSLIPEQLYVANFLQALHIACREPPTAGDAFYPDAASIFNETLISGPSSTTSKSTHHGLHGRDLALAIALPIIGGMLIISAICCCCFVSARRRRNQMAASGRMVRIHEAEARIYGHSIDSKNMWGDKEPPREMSQLTPSTATTTTATRWSRHFSHNQKQQFQEPGVALGDHKEADRAPLRDSFHPRDHVGPGEGQIRDPNLHELYFGLDKEEEDGYAITTTADPGGWNSATSYVISPSSAATTSTAHASAPTPPVAPATATTPTTHGLGLYDRIRAEHAANPSLQYQQQPQQQ